MKPCGIPTALAVTAAAIGTGLAASGPAAAGGIGDFLSPAFGTNCTNHRTTPHNSGATTAGTGTASSNLLGLPIGSPLNQCGGADNVTKLMKYNMNDQAAYNYNVNTIDVPISEVGG